MTTYISLLRGINVSGQKSIRMADLKTSLQKLPISNLQTYIQSGNLVFQSALETTPLEENIAELILNDFGFKVPVIVKPCQIFASILVSTPFLSIDESRTYFAFLKTVPDQKNVTNFGLLEFENESFQITNECVYFLCKKGLGKAKLNNNLIENKLKVTATTRNFKTMTKLVAMSSALNSSTK